MGLIFHTPTDVVSQRPLWVTIGIIFGIAMVVIMSFGFLEFPYLFMPSPYLGFMRQGTNYYSKMAQACDLVLKQHRPTAADSVQLYEGMILPCTLRISNDDQTLPKIIRKLQPVEVLVSTNRVWMEIPPERMGGFGLVWEQDDLQSNVWNLYASAEGPKEIVYQKKKW
jgi:hypothetical protein